MEQSSLPSNNLTLSSVTGSNVDFLDDPSFSMDMKTVIDQDEPMDSSNNCNIEKSSHVMVSTFPNDLLSVLDHDTDKREEKTDMSNHICSTDKSSLVCVDKSEISSISKTDILTDIHFTQHNTIDIEERANLGDRHGDASESMCVNIIEENSLLKNGHLKSSQNISEGCSEIESQMMPTDQFLSNKMESNKQGRQLKTERSFIKTNDEKHSAAPDLKFAIDTQQEMEVDSNTEFKVKIQQLTPSSQPVQSANVTEEKVFKEQVKNVEESVFDLDDNVEDERLTCNFASFRKARLKQDQENRLTCNSLNTDLTLKDSLPTKSYRQESQKPLSENLNDKNCCKEDALSPERNVFKVPAVPLKKLSPNQKKCDLNKQIKKVGIDTKSLKKCLDKNGMEAELCKEGSSFDLNKNRGQSAVNSANSSKPPLKELTIRKVLYMYSKELIQKCDTMQKIPERASMVHSLIEAYGLLKYMELASPSAASDETVNTFHSSDYINFLKKLSEQDDEEIYDDEAAQYGLTYDCPVNRGVYDYAALVGGATVNAVEKLIEGHCDVALNWYGGWHHAQRDSASGFCYINDIVLGILKLKQKYSRILYVDLDLHHGDGVENAFSATSSVMTVSLHKYTTGFFPGSGSLDDMGVGKGKYYTVNVPLHDGIQDQEYVALFCRIIKKVNEKFQPEAIVCQCGADGLAGDPMDSFNLSHMTLGKCVYFMLNWKLPTLLLGGGGYNHTNTARCWAFLTALTVGKKLPQDIPDHKFFTDYGPDYEIGVVPGNRKDQNTREHLRHVHKTVMDNLDNI